MGNPKKKIGPDGVGRFDQKNTMYSRARWDPSMQELGRKHYGVRQFGDQLGYALKDWAFSMAAWYVEREFGRGNIVGDSGMYEWYPDASKIPLRDRMTPGERWMVSDPERMSREIKWTAKFLGASLAGICKLDRRWLYSYRFHPHTFEHSPIDIPPEFEHAVVMAHEMDYELTKTSPAYPNFTAQGRAYSMMAFVASSLAHYIRSLGYKAIPCGNDTALSTPLAIDAGLGELGRNGLLITEKFGPRVRISKVFTDLPLVADKPIESGVRELCDTCGRCAEECPGRAISFGEPTNEGPTISNSSGAYKWYINPEKCFEFWVRNTGGCGNCIRVCPFNKPLGWLHDMTRFLVGNASWLDPALLRMDKLLGYGRRARVEAYWG
jgi:reductive dehalogenase